MGVNIELSRNLNFKKMATQAKLPKQWSLLGNRYDTNSDLPAHACPGVVNIPATHTCIHSMKGYAGKPIEANLAVRFIRNFKRKFSIYQHVPTAQEFINLSTDEQLAKHLETRTHLHHVLKFTHGMTFDRDLVLKIMSQPKCEGIRCYLCARPNSSQTSDGFDMSLVLVGVDQYGVDLHYKEDYKPVPKPGNDTGAIPAAAPMDDPGDPNVPNNSLNGEYSTEPPNNGITKDFEWDDAIIDDRYVLLKIASKIK